jgi:hypothetical protein
VTRPDVVAEVVARFAAGGVMRPDVVAEVVARFGTGGAA